MKYQYFEVCEHVAVHASHHGHELGGELEGGALEAEVLGRAGEDEAVVDVYEVTLAVQEDVAVVTILHLGRYIIIMKRNYFVKMLILVILFYCNEMCSLILKSSKNVSRNFRKK